MAYTSSLPRNKFWKSRIFSSFDGPQIAADRWCGKSTDAVCGPVYLELSEQESSSSECFFRKASFSRLRTEISARYCEHFFVSSSIWPNSVLSLAAPTSPPFSHSKIYWIIG